MNVNVNRIMLRIILIWLVISSIYYIDAIFIGVGALKDVENIYHKLVKYTVCFTLTCYLIFSEKKLLTFLYVFLFGLLALLSVVNYQGVTIFATTMLIIGTMIGLVFILPSFYKHIGRINNTLLWTGVIIGGISVLELTVFSQNMTSYWAATGGVRSISSLLNPTNSGGYAAIILILALTTNIKNKVLKTLFLIMPLITLVFSGSRTAWLSLGLVICMTPFLNDQASKNLRRYIPLMIMMTIISIIGYIYISGSISSGIDSQYRGLDTYTASIRLENFLSYFSRIDMDMLLPDINDRNVMFIADNFYLVMLNFFGIVGFFVLLFFVMIMFFINIKMSAVEPYIISDLSAWKIIFLYLMISGMSNSFINSFPVNQLFFVSFGYFIYKARLYKYHVIYKSFD